MYTFMRVVFLFCILGYLCCGTAFAQQEGQKVFPSHEKAESKMVRLVEPVENTEVIGKRPDIRVELAEPFESLVVILDSTDVTQMITKTEKGFTYKPITNLSSGFHSLKVMGKDSEGKEIENEFSFQIRHYNAFDEASSNNLLSVISETYLGRSGYGDTTPYRKIEGNLKSDNKLKKDQWEATLNTNIRYLEQSEHPQDPLKRGFDTANWIFTGSYTKEATKAKISLGDVLVNETPYTVNALSRKGSVFEAEYDRYQARAFLLRSKQSFGIDGGIGTGGSTDDRIFGASFGIKFFDKKMEFRGTYVSGGDRSTGISTSSTTSTTTTPSTTYGTTTTGGRRRGDVASFLMTTNLLQDKLRIEAEAAFSNYNPDTSVNGVGSKKDAAYRIKAEGAEGIYNYAASYEYLGRDFGTVGNQGLERDKQRVIYTNGLRFDTQSVMLTLLRANDNVRGDALFGENVNYNGNLTYSYTGITNLPISVNYIRDQQRSHNDPNVRINKDTNTISASINYTTGNWTFGFIPAFSYMDDKASTDVDTQTMTYTFTPAFNGESFSVSSSLSFNRTFTRVPHAWTDTYTVGFNLRKDFFDKKLVFESANTYTKTKTDNRLTDTNTLNLTGTLSYNLKEYFKNALEPTVGLRGSYLKIIDEVNTANEKKEIRCFLVFTLAAPFAF